MTSVISSTGLKIASKREENGKEERKNNHSYVIKSSTFEFLNDKNVRLMS